MSQAPYPFPPNVIQGLPKFRRGDWLVQRVKGVWIFGELGRFQGFQSKYRFRRLIYGSPV